MCYFYLGIILGSLPKSTIRCDNALIIVAEGIRRPSEGCFPEVIRSIQQLAELLPALLGQADPIRSFQYVYNPLIARLSRHNLKLFPDAIIQRCPFSSSFNCPPPPTLTPRHPLRGLSSHSLTSFCGSWIAEFHGLASFAFKKLAPRTTHHSAICILPL